MKSILFTLLLITVSLSVTMPAQAAVTGSLLGGPGTNDPVIGGGNPRTWPLADIYTGTMANRYPISYNSLYERSGALCGGTLKKNSFVYNRKMKRFKDGKVVTTKHIPRTDAKDFFDGCSYRIAARMGGSTAITSQTSGLTSLCKQPKAPKLKYCFKNFLKQGTYTASEIHGITPLDRNEKKPYNKAVSSYSVTVWRFKFGATNHNPVPIFSRRVDNPTRANPWIKPGYTDEGGANADGQKRCWPLKYPRTALAGKCMDDQAYYKGGRSDGEYFTSSSAAHAGPLFESSPGGCDNDWRHDRLIGTGDPSVKAGSGSITSYMKVNIDGYPVPNNYTNCFWNIGESEHRYMYNTTNNRPDGPSIVWRETRTVKTIPESIAISFNPDGKLYYVLQPLQGYVYIVTVHAISGRENILGSHVNSYLPVPAVEDVDGDDPICVVNCGPPPGPDPAPNPTVDQDQTTSENRPASSETQFSGIVATEPFPSLNMTLEAPESTATGKSALWRSSLNSNDDALTVATVAWPRKVAFMMADSQVYEPGWGKTKDGQQFYTGFGQEESGFFSLRAEGSGVNKNQSVDFPQMPASWQLSALADRDSANPFATRHIIRLTSDIGQQSISPLATSSAFAHRSDTLIPNQSESEPQYGQSVVYYETGRFIDTVSRVAGHCNNHTRLMRATTSSTAVRTPADPGSWVAQGFMYHQLRNSSNSTFVCPLSPYTISVTSNVDMSGVKQGTLHRSQTFGEIDSNASMTLPFACVGVTCTATITTTQAANLETGGYLVTMNGIPAGSEWRMNVRSNADDRDYMQWAGLPDPNTGNIYGPDYDTLLNTENGAGSSCVDGTCPVYSNFRVLSVLGAQPGQ
jgi:hypothetical protein